MARSSPLASLFAKLRDAGFDPAHVRRALLPSWWDDELAASEVGVYTALNHVASRLGVSVAALRAEGPLVVAPRLNVRHKLSKDTSRDDIRVAEVLALRVAQAAALAARVPPPRSIPSASDIRQEILDAGAPWVGFEQLLDWCWANGILVLHVADFPKATKKPHGLAAVVGGRPALVLCRNERRPSWLLFHLAHELGHVGLGHVEEGAALLDEHIDPESREADEVAANSFALAVITGSADRELASVGRWPRTADMLRAARQYAATHRVDPGHVALNYAKTMTGRTGARFFALAGAVTRELEAGSDAVAMMRARLLSGLDWDALHEDARDFVERMTGVAS